MDSSEIDVVLLRDVLLQLGCVFYSMWHETSSTPTTSISTSNQSGVRFNPSSYGDHLSSIPRRYSSKCQKILWDFPSKWDWIGPIFGFKKFFLWLFNVGFWWTAAVELNWIEMFNRPVPIWSIWADGCCEMLMDVARCWGMLRDVEGCWGMLRDTKWGFRMLRDARGC